MRRIQSSSIAFVYSMQKALDFITFTVENQNVRFNVQLSSRAAAYHVQITDFNL